ncbi:hypothetical protein [Frigidibacter sp. MR17.24]|uniref:hypothetical protein n=1 Tax=Frigidibacter sp. MR17.24 TaxID=3127345 RepID=UPI0030130FEF
MAEGLSADLVVWILLALHLALIGAALWLSSRRLWWRNSLAALRHGPVPAVVTSVAPDGSAMVAIRPARSSRRGAALVVAGGATLVAAFLTSTVLAFFLALWPMAVGIFSLAAGGRYRRPSRISLSLDGLETAELRLPLDRILGFGSARSGGLGVTVTDGTPVLADLPLPGGAGVARLPALRSTFLERSYLVTVLPVGGKRQVIAGGLTAEAATRVKADLNQALSRLRH